MKNEALKKRMCKLHKEYVKLYGSYNKGLCDVTTEGIHLTETTFFDMFDTYEREPLGSTFAYKCYTIFEGVRFYCATNINKEVTENEQD